MHPSADVVPENLLRVYIEFSARRINGIVALDLHDVGWTFVPAAAWTAGTHHLVGRAFLKDPQGNQIGKAFEIATDASDTPRASGTDELDVPSRLPFIIGSAR